MKDQIFFIDKLTETLEASSYKYNTYM